MAVIYLQVWQCMASQCMELGYICSLTSQLITLKSCLPINLRNNRISNINI